MVGEEEARASGSGGRFEKWGDQLAELGAAIRAAYVSKEREAQVAEAEVAQIAHRIREKFAVEEMREWRAREERHLVELEQRERSEMKNYGRELREAACARELTRVMAEEREERERRALEEVSRAIEEAEARRRSKEKRDLADRLNREELIFREIGEIRRQEEREIEEEGRERELLFLQETEKRDEALRKAREEREAARAAVIEVVAQSLLDHRSRELEKAVILADLVAEEICFQEEERLRERETKNQIAREEIAAEIERHRRTVEERKLRYQIEEEEFAIFVTQRVLEDEKVQRMTREARKREQLRYREQLQDIIQERRNRRKEELGRLENQLQRDRERAVQEEKEVVEARMRLLLDHAGVSSFIKKTALSAEERATIGDNNLRK